MHIEPGLIQGAKLALSYGTAAAAGTYSLKLAWDVIRERGLAALAARSVVTTILTLVFFEILPHFPVGVSEVHFILGTTLFLVFGPAAAAIGLASGLFLQGLVISPFDLPQLGANLTTLLVPMFAMTAIARRVIAPGTAYVDLDYGQVLKLSALFQGGVVAWVAFWVIYGQGFGVESMASLLTFAAAYSVVIVIEPLVDLVVLWSAKSMRWMEGSRLVAARLYARV